MSKKNTILKLIESGEKIIKDEFHPANITLDDVSALLHYTPQYFSAKFKKITGVNFSHYLQSVRIAHSCQLLQFTNIKISEIATLVGYQDLKQFEFVFRKHINRTPMQHRQFCRQNREIQFILQ